MADIFSQYSQYSEFLVRILLASLLGGFDRFRAGHAWAGSGFAYPSFGQHGCSGFHDPF